MKKIIITSWGMEIGGVERSLIGLLNAIDYKQYSVDLFLCRHYGEFMDMIPTEVNLLPEIKPYTTFQTSIKDAIKCGNIRVAVARIISKLKMKMECSDSLLGYYVKQSLKFLPSISEEEYDLAISFLTPHFIADEKIKAKQKIAWIHTDYTAINIDAEFELNMWKQYEHIAGISQAAVDAFIEVFPSLKDRVLVIENIIMSNTVHQQALIKDVSKEIDDSVTSICTVGRFCDAKAYDNCIRICRKLIDKGHNIKWYAIGYGGDEPLMRNLIQENNLEEHFIILGKKDNPYPYMKACDFYMQLSRYEGKSVAVTEAKILCKPVVITDFPTSVNHLDDGIDGFIVPMEMESCVNEIEKILNDKDRVASVIKYLEEYDYSNCQEINFIYKLIK